MRSARDGWRLMAAQVFDMRWIDKMIMGASAKDGARGVGGRWLCAPCVPSLMEVTVDARCVTMFGICAGRNNDTDTAFSRKCEGATQDVYSEWRCCREFGGRTCRLPIS